MIRSHFRPRTSTAARSKRRSHLALRLEQLEDRCVPTTSLTTSFLSPYRSIDGSGNNVAHPDWGSAGEDLIRVAPADYGDGIFTPAGADRPSARKVSNVVVAHSAADTHDSRNLTAYLYVWGQFLDHDLDLTQPPTSGAEAFNVPVPTGDPYFDPNSTGTQTIALDRSRYDPSTGVTTPRQQINQITAWIDGSMVYGSDAATAKSLRAPGGGLLKTSAGNLPPTDATGSFLAGDVRANENIELTSMQTLFMREHNRLAAQIAKANPGMSDEDIYQRARALVIGEIQAITYNEWLPALLGPGALKSYQGYNPKVNPEIANELSTAAFRFHTAVNDDVEFFDNNGQPITFSYIDDQGQSVTVDGEVALKDAFFNPTLFRQSPLSGILKYAASTHAETIDTQLVDSLRNFLFGQPGQGGLDLASLNIQRGRDHGLADYNTVRAVYGLPRVQTFADITSNVDLQNKLQALYGTVDNIDLWVGAFAEDHIPGTSTGPLTRRILIDQFQRLRDGDRFWYQRAFSGTQLSILEQTTLADVIQRNTSVRGLQQNVFFFQAQASGQVFFDANGNGFRDRGEAPLANVRVDLINPDGAVIAFAFTDATGHYTFNQFPETGRYQVRVLLPAKLTATTKNPRSFLIATGDVSVRGLDFGVRLAFGTTSASAADQLAAVEATLNGQ